MDKKYLKKYNLMESHKQFLRLSGLNEWSFMPNNLDEADDEPQTNDENIPPLNNNIDSQDNNTDSQPNNDMMSGGEENMPSISQKDEMPIGDEMDSDENSNMSLDNGNQEILPQENNNELTDEEEDELDVTDLTDAQEKLNKKINSVGKEVNSTNNSISQMDALLDKISSLIDSNNTKIEDLKKEIQKRNPTPLEKLDLRSVEDSKPYNIRPNDYWDNKIETSPNYVVYDENNLEKKEKDYVITDKDINDTNDSIIGNTFDKFNIDLEKIFGF